VKFVEHSSSVIGRGSVYVRSDIQFVSFVVVEERQLAFLVESTLPDTLLGGLSGIGASVRLRKK
jgi:hypothetical protein